MSKLFGGTDSSAQDAQIGANAATQAFIESQAKQGREDLFNIFPVAQQNLLSGQQGATNVLAGAFAPQLQSFQGGNVGAQQALINGLQQQQNALLGGQVDLSQLTPQAANVGLGQIPAGIGGQAGGQAGQGSPLSGFGGFSTIDSPFDNKPQPADQGLDNQNVRDEIAAFASAKEIERLELMAPGDTALTNPPTFDELLVQERKKLGLI